MSEDGDLLSRTQRQDDGTLGALDAPVEARAMPPVKRALDLLVGSIVLVLLLPVLAAAVVAIWLDTGGPAFFRQERFGAGGRPFTILKLRTMAAANDDAEHRTYYEALMRGDATPVNGVYKLADDTRVTKVGRVLRRFSIDEVPQLFNVVKGDMSLVGPRPPLAHEVGRYDDRAWKRLAGRPGLTGLWQVSGRCELTFADMIELDLEYWERWSLGLDVSILARTPLVVLLGRGAA